MTTQPFIQDKLDELTQKFAQLGSKRAHSPTQLTQTDLQDIRKQILLDITTLIKERQTMPSSVPSLEAKILMEGDINLTIRKRVGGVL